MKTSSPLRRASRTFKRHRLLLVAAGLFGILPILFASEADAQHSWAQSYGVGSYDRFGAPYDTNHAGSGHDRAIGVAPMPDGGFVVAGQLDLPELQPATYDAGGGGESNAALVRYAPNGTLIWHRMLKLDNGGSTAVHQVDTDASGNIFISGGKEPSNHVDARNSGTPYVAKLSPDGALLWENGMGDYAAGIYPFHWMSLTPDGGVAALAPRGLSSGGQRAAPMMAKFGPTGAFEFQQTYRANPVNFQVDARGFCASRDGQRYVVLATYYERTGFVVILTNAAGEVVTQRQFVNTENSNETPLAVVPTAEGGFAVLSRLGDGYYGYFAAIVRKLDGNLNPLFEKRLEMKSGLKFTGGSLRQTSDGGFLVGGDGIIPNINGSRDAIVLKLTPGGEVQSAMAIGGKNEEGASQYTDPVMAVRQTGDGGYVFATTTLSYASDATGKPDWWVVKTDANRRVANFGDYQSPDVTEHFASVNITSAPEPASAFFADGSLSSGVTSLPNLVVEDLAPKTGINKPNITFQAASPIVAPTPPPALPKGKLGTTYFGANQFGRVMRFTALITDAAASFKVRVQASTTPDASGSWQDLPNGTAGRMIKDYSIAAKPYVLNSTNYPLQNGLYFRAIASAAGYADSISDADGPFNLASTTPVAGPVELSVRNGNVPANAPLEFSATVSNDASGSGMRVRLQSSRTPGDEGSWSDFVDSNAGTLAQTAPGQYAQSTANYPTGRTLYFRAVASRSNHGDSLSNVVGPYDLKRVPPPTVAITPPTSGAGGSGQTINDPIILFAGETFGLAATASSEEKIAVLRLLVDESTVQRVENASTASVQVRAGKLGHHRLRAFAITDGKVVGRSAPVHIYVVRAPGAGQESAAARKGTEVSRGKAATSQVQNVWRTVRHGDWGDYRTWADEQGNPAPENFGGPGFRDLAIVNHEVALAFNGGNRTCDAVTINDGNLIGPMSLTVVETLTVGSNVNIDQVSITIEAGGELRLIGNSKVSWSGQLINRGKMVVDGRGGIGGALNALGGTEFLILRNEGQALFGGGALIELSTASTSIGTLEALKLLGNDGSSILANDGASLLANDGASIITHDGSSLIGNDGSGIVSGGAGNIVSGGGGNILANDGASIAFRGGGGIAAARPASGATGKAATAGESFTVDGGVLDFGSSPQLASNLQIIGAMTINGGVVKGTGVIFGDVTQNGGFISPGNSAGALGIDGNFSQGSGGTMISEIGGPTPAQFDQLVVTGTANVNGKLNLRAINGYAPESDGTFSPLIYSAGSGSLTTSSNAQMTLRPTGLLGTLDAGAPAPPPAKLLNIATRLRVEQGENALIGGFILTGSAPKKVIIRALGPSLEGRGIAGGLVDPTLELFAPNGSTFNNNWRDSQQGEIEATTIPPSDDREAAIVATLEPGVAYTAIVRGLDDTTGVGLVEVYDLDSAAASTLANISTRGLVQTGENVMIGGLIIGGDQPAKVLVRAIGPSLAAQGVSGVLDDPTLELNDANGNVISNDDWRATQEDEVMASTVPPTNEREAAIVATLTPGNYTAIVRGKGDTTGVALVEAYNLQ